jgi:hypothetical protein
MFMKPFGLKSRLGRLAETAKAILSVSRVSIEQLDKGYLTGPKIMTFMYEGLARPR